MEQAFCQACVIGKHVDPCNIDINVLSLDWA